LVVAAVDQEILTKLDILEVPVAAEVEVQVQDQVQELQVKEAMVVTGITTELVLPVAAEADILR